MPDRPLGLEQAAGGEHRTETLLRIAVAAGVPLRIAEYQRDRRPVQWLLERARWAGGMVAAHGDILQFPTKAHTSGGKRYPSTAEVCNALIEGIACAALLAEGGITFLGLHFDATLQGRGPTVRQPSQAFPPSDP
jgi:hypothetical protein